jgi:uncharacterized protein (TIGR02145 family)
MNKIIILTALLSVIIFFTGCEDWSPVILGSVEVKTFVDSRDGKVYKYVDLAGKRWMAENLAYLPEVTPHETGSDSVACYYVYDYSGTSVVDAKSGICFRTYGVLYNAVAAQKACPSGWHLPVVDDWDNLAIKALGYARFSGGSWNDAGRFLKAKNSPGNPGWWNNYAYADTPDTFKFCGLPAGFRDKAGFCTMEHDRARWWEEIKTDTTLTRYWELDNSDDLNREKYGSKPKSIYVYGFSIRCVR